MSTNIFNRLIKNRISSDDTEMHSLLLEMSEYMQDLITICDRNGKLEYASPSHKLLGFKSEELVGKSMYNFIHPSDKESSKEALKLFLQGKTETTVEARFMHANGTYFWFEIIAKQLSKNRILFNSRDITKRKESEVELIRKHKENLILKNTQRALIDNNKDVIIIVNYKKEITFISANIKTLFGWEDTDLINENICKLIPQNNQTTCSEKFDLCLNNNERFTFEGQLKQKDGTLCDIELNCKNFLEHKSISGILINIADISDRKKAELEIRESEERYRALHDASFGGIAMHDQGVIFDCNHGLEEITGYAREELLNMNGLLLIAKDYRDLVRKNIETGYTECYEAIGERKDGQQYDLRLQGKNIPYKGKNVRIVEFRDISEQKATERKLIDQQSLFKTMFNTIKEGIVITDIDGTIIMANESMQTIFGLDAYQLINGSIKRLFPEEEIYNDVVKRCFNSNNNSYTHTTYLHANGEAFQGEIFGTKLYNSNGDWIGNIAVNRDITKSIKTLEDLQKAKSQAEESSRLKTEFINNMSHEVRTPMNGIIGFSEMLNMPNLSEEKRNYFIKIIQNSSEQLLRIIDDILEISILETNKLKVNYSEVCLNDLIMEIYANYDNITNEHKVPLQIKKGLSDEDSTFTSDESKLKKILNSLLANAIKYTDKGHIELGYYLENKTLKIYIKDTGSGIDPEDHELIFERFAQAEKDISQKKGGLGLGLSISKENAKLLEGEISVKSALKEGATFTLSLPFNNATSDETNNTETTQGLHSDKFTILVAEDEDVNYLYLEAVIDTEYKDKYILLHAHNGQEAIDIALERNDIDLVLMDIKMPIINGHEATEKIKAEKPNLTIIAQTAYTTAKDIDAAREHGCDDFISKPINRNDLIELINKHIDVKL